MKTTFRYLIPFVLVAVLSATGFAQMRSNKLGIGASGSMVTYSGEYSTKSAGIGGGLSATYSPWQIVGFRVAAGFGESEFTSTSSQPGSTGAYGPSKVTMFSGTGAVAANFMPNSSFNPYVTVGGGLIYFVPRTKTGVALLPNGMMSDIVITFGGGFDYFISEFASISAGAEYGLINSDFVDGRKATSANDSYLKFGLEVRYYFFDKAFLGRMLEAVKARYE